MMIKRRKRPGETLSLSFSSVPSPLTLSLVLPSPRAIQIKKTGDESGAVAVTFEGGCKDIDLDRSRSE